MSDGGFVFSATDPWDASVVLTKATWEVHIVERHPEMAGNEFAVQKTIEKPEAVYRSSWNPDAKIFLSRETESTYPRLYTRVVVGYVDDSAGYVETAMFSKTIGGVKAGELLYVKPKL